jgi:hypothetical protein
MLKSNLSIYENAPDLLLDSIADVNGMLEKAKAKSGANESYKFWRKVANNMKFAWDYMNSTKWIHDKNIQLTQENNFLRKYVADIELKLNAYEVIRDLKISGKFDETIARVDAFMEDPENMKLFELKKKLANGE